MCGFSLSVCLQHSGVEHWDQAGHLWEPGFSSQCRSLPHCPVLQHQRQRLCFRREVSECRLLAFCKSISVVLIILCSVCQHPWWCFYFGQRNTASLGAGRPQQEDQAHRVSDRQAEEDCEMCTGTRPWQFFVHAACFTGLLFLKVHLSFEKWLLPLKVTQWLGEELQWMHLGW